MKFLLPCLAAALAAAVAPAAARAGDATGIVLESYVGDRPNDAKKLLDPLWTQFEQLGYQHGAPLIKPIEAAFSAPGQLPETEVDAAFQLAARAYDQWLNGEFDVAATSAAEALQTFVRTPGTFAEQPKRRKTLARTLVVLSLAHHRLQHGAESHAAMAELVRSFSDQAFDRASFGPEAYKLFKAVKADVEQQRTGGLRVRASNDDVSIFVNERFVGAGEVVEPALPPGIYRVYTQRGNRAGRLHRVNITAGSSETLTIDWDLDRALVTADWVGLSYANEADQRRAEVEQATALARGLSAERVVLVRAGEYEGRRAIIGTALTRDGGKPLRSAAVAVEPTPPSADTLRAFAGFLHGGGDGEGLILIDPYATSLAADDGAAGAPWYRDGVGWGITGAGVALLAGSGLLQLSARDHNDRAMEARDETDARALRDTAERRQTLALVTGGVGLAAVIAGAIKLALHDRPENGRQEHLSIGLRSDSLGLTLSGTF